MKISKETMEILKNFASINISILFRPGTKIKTVTPQRNVVAVASVSESFSREIPIYDLNQFLGTSSLFSDPEFDFGESAVRISHPSDDQTVTFEYAAKEAIVSAPEKDVSFPADAEVNFKLTKEAFNAAMKASSVMALPNISIIGKEGIIYLTVDDVTGATKHTWKRKVGTTNHKFTIIYRSEILKFLPRDYNVSISSKLISRFESENKDVTYFTAMENGSKFS